MTTRRRLVRVITRLNIGGPARQALLLTHALSGEFDTTLLTGRAGGAEGELSDPRVTPRYVPLVRPPSPPNDARAIVAVRQVLVRERPDVVHTHMAKAGTIARLAALSMRRHPRLVHTFHGHVLEGYFGATTARGILEVERALARRTDRLVAVSVEVRDALLDLRIGRPEQYRVIPLGFDLTRHWEVDGPSGVLRDSLGLADDVPLVGIVGRIVPIKDHPVMLRALRDLPGVHLAVLGDGEQRPAMERLAAELGVADRTHFVGWWTDIPAAMADMDVVALTSRNEGTPVALIEASACGRPTVSTDVGGVRSVVRDGETGYLVPSGDSGGLAEAIATILARPQLGAELGAAGRAHSRTFTQERLVDDIRALYAEL